MSKSKTFNQAKNSMKIASTFQGSVKIEEKVMTYRQKSVFLPIGINKC